MSVEALDGLHHVGAGVARVRRELFLACSAQDDRHSCGALRLAGLRMLLDSLQREPCGEHGKKSRSEAQLRDAVGDRNRSERQELVEADGLLMPRPQVENQFPDQCTQRSADRQPTDDAHNTSNATQRHAPPPKS